MYSIFNIFRRGIRILVAISDNFFNLLVRNDDRVFLLVGGWGFWWVYSTWRSGWFVRNGYSEMVCWDFLWNLLWIAFALDVLDNWWDLSWVSNADVFVCDFLEFAHDMHFIGLEFKACWPQTKLKLCNSR